ncbi:MAG TPA: hypothetical protein VLS89_17460 [Candidatus Nanopelagicales bacterium]|nr:hypothetical protein [Candidatus Nanopelagicales bacterium]
MNGLTFDTGALICLENRRQRMKAVWEAAKQRNQIITIPTVVLAEWWREPRRALDVMIATCFVEPLNEELARIAGGAVAACPGAGVIDAIVMASAAQRGDVVYTSDIDDLMRLKDACFPAVKVLSASGEK